MSVISAGIPAASAETTVGGDPSSVEFCHRANLDYVSCSPFRVPIARLAAAQAALRGKAAGSDQR